jgi:hypothetical protein
MPPRARQAAAAETAVDTTPTQAPEDQAPALETPEDQAPPAETAAAPEEPEPAAEPESDYVQALLRERDGYLRYDRKDRAAAVDAELKSLGIKPRRR